MHILHHICMFRISFCIKSPEAFIFGDVDGDFISQEGLKGVKTRTSGILRIPESGFRVGISFVDLATYETHLNLSLPKKEIKRS